ncbi:MAG: hypothetical protein R6U50_05575 [Desulfobacterales bacterium]
MAKFGKFLPLVIVILIGVFFQLIFIAVDIRDTPIKAAVEFAKAYYMLDDDAMEKRICKKALENGMVDDYLYHVRQKAENRGYEMAYYKSLLSDIHTEIIELDDKTAKIKIVAEKRSAINPVYHLVGKLFNLTQAYEVEKTLYLVKEKDRWRVCTPLLDHV